MWFSSWHNLPGLEAGETNQKHIPKGGNNKPLLMAAKKNYSADVTRS